MGSEGIEPLRHPPHILMPTDLQSAVGNTALEWAGRDSNPHSQRRRVYGAGSYHCSTDPSGNQIVKEQKWSGSVSHRRIRLFRPSLIYLSYRSITTTLYVSLYDKLDTKVVSSPYYYFRDFRLYDESLQLLKIRHNHIYHILIPLQ